MLGTGWTEIAAARRATGTGARFLDRPATAEPPARAVACLLARIAANPFGPGRLVLHVGALTGEDAVVDEKAQRAGSMSSDAGGLDAWFARAQGGEPAAVDGLLRAVFPTAQRFAARSCSSREDAEDAVQDALTALARRVGALRAAETVTSWLFVTIRHACLRRVPGVILVPLDAVPEPARPDIASGVVDRLVVADAIAALPAAQRDVVVPVDVLGLPAERTAQRVRATKSRLHRARRALAASISEPTIRTSA